MSTRFVSFVLALVLLVAQQLGPQHLLTHGLEAATAPVGASAAVSSNGEPAHDDAAADGLCQACVSLLMLGSATLAAQPAWALADVDHPAPAAPAVAALPRRAAAPYLARAPPSRA